MKRLLVIPLSFFICACINMPGHYGKLGKRSLQSIPGRIECELYDEGGEEVAYHDADSINNGSGKLNPANGSMLNEFRIKEGVDISYTKGNGIDNNSYNKTEPVLDQLYVGWTEPGEWINYTIQVSETAWYAVGLMYTSNGEGTIALDVDGQQVDGLIKVASTYDAQDSIAWRQWHHWNKINLITRVKINEGIRTIRLRIVGNGNMNFDYLQFKKD